MYESGWWIGWAAGSWGTSWGDIAVAETWDTDQGVARNLAKNLKFERVEDVEVRAVGGGTQTGYERTKSRADGRAKAFGGGATSGAKLGFAKGKIRANGFSRAVGGGAYVFYADPVVSADSSARGRGGGVSAGVDRGSANGSVSVRPAFTPPAISGVKGRVAALGVQNPTDEQLAIIASLLTRKNKTGIRHPYG